MHVDNAVVKLNLRFISRGGVGVNRHGSVEGPLDIEAVVVRCRHGLAWGGAV